MTLYPRSIHLIIIILLLCVTVIAVSSASIALRLLVIKRCKDPPQIGQFYYPTLSPRTVMDLLHLTLQKRLGNFAFKLQVQDLPKTVIDHFMTKDLLERVESVTGKRFVYARESDPDRIFVKLYHRSTDRIGWHYDPNFTRGKRYTVIFILHRDPCSTANLHFKDCMTGDINILDEEGDDVEGRGVIFDASQVFHRVTAQHSVCRRLTLIIPLYEDTRFYVGGRLHQSLQKLGNRIGG